MTLTRRAFISTALAASALPARAGGTVTLGGGAFGSYWRLTLPQGVDPAPLSTRIAAIIEDVDLTFSPFRAASALSRFNLSGETEIPLKGHFREIAALSLDIASETGGAFDPTVGPLVARYGFGPIAGDRPGTWEGLGLTGPTLNRLPGLTLDFCGIAKGHALDRIRAAAGELGYQSAMIDLGGEIASLGRHPDGRPWRVALDGAALAFEPGAQTIATSGLTAQSYQVGANTYGHIIDPRKGGPADAGLLSVSVFDRSATRADAIATALFALGPEDGPALAEARALDAVFLMPGKNAPQPIFTGASEGWRI